MQYASMFVAPPSVWHFSALVYFQIGDYPEIRRIIRYTVDLSLQVAGHTNATQLLRKSDFLHRNALELP